MVSSVGRLPLGATVPTATILPSPWIATSVIQAALANIVVTLPPTPNDVSRLPLGLYRITLNPLCPFGLPEPAATIFPSGWMATASALPTRFGEYAVVTLPPVPNVGSRVPSEL